MMTLDEARAVMSGTWQGAATAAGQPLAGVSSDSRTIEAGELFFALGGPRFDGHDYLAAAAQRGAAAAVVERDVAPPAGLPLIRVANTLSALGELARSVRAAAKVPLVGITGSVGKTTTKEMTATLLGARGPVLKTEGNLNNDIGLPLTLLRLRPEHTVAVVEMGMSAPGELARLTAIARPDVAVITNVAPVHLEFFASVDEIAAAKAEILHGLAPRGVAVLNRDDARLRALGERLDREVLWFGTDRVSRVRAQGWRMNGRGLWFELILAEESATVRLPLAGAHAMMNFLAAAAVAHRFGVPARTIAEAAAGMRPAAHRGSVVALGSGILLIDDSYNANPIAVEAAAQVLAAQHDRRRVAFLGDMLELGLRALDLHREVGERIADGLDVLVAIGALAQGFVEGARRRIHDPERLLSFADAVAAAAAAPDIVRAGDAVLVKASRGVRAEAVVEALVSRFGVVEA